MEDITDTTGHYMGLMVMLGRVQTGLTRDNNLHLISNYNITRRYKDIKQ